MFCVKMSFGGNAGCFESVGHSVVALGDCGSVRLTGRSDLVLCLLSLPPLRYAVLTNGNHVEQEKVSLQHDTESQESCF